MYQLDFKKPTAIHFIGIGGISMSGLAQILLKEGFVVSGSDSTKSPLTTELERLGANIYYGQRRQNITDDISVVVLNIDKYNSRKENKYNQPDQRTDEELLDVKKYIQTDFQKEKAQTQEDEEIKRAKEYAEEVTKEFDYDNDEFLQELLTGIINKEEEQK